MDYLLLLRELPTWYQFAAVLVLGAVLASFANVVAYRLHTNASLSGRSRCFSCGHTLQWFELVPVVSYVVLRGRCRECRSRIPRRDLWVEILMAGLFALSYALAATFVQLLLWWLLIVVLLIVTLYDVEHYIIPNELVVALATISLAVFVASAWPVTVPALLNGGLAVVAAAGLYAALWKFSGGAWLGFGDVKLAAALGPLLTIEQSVSMVVLSFWIGAVVGIVLVLLPQWWRRAWASAHARPALTFKSEIPFAPFITIAFLVVYIYGIDVFSLFIG